MPLKTKLKMKIGHIGLGAIGQLYVGHLVNAFDSVIVYDLDKDCMYRAKALGAIPASSPGNLAGKCEIIVLALPSPEAVRNSLLGPQGVLENSKSGTLILDLSTIDPFTCKNIYQMAKERGVSYLDSPISGGQKGGAGTDGARAANVSFMVGGDKEAFERAKVVMKVLGAKWFYLGPSGSGSTVKLISNLVAGLHNLIACEAFVLAAAAGISPEKLLEVFDETDAKSFWLTDYFASRILNKNFEPGFSVDLQYKDHRLAGELARKLKIPVQFNSLAVEFYQMMRSQGLGHKDLVEAVNFLGRLADVDIYKPRKTIND
jgi:3-hydroxyisobutyrate dehydrogenase-like beta-hydroxyacid dehydrogenase